MQSGALTSIGMIGGADGPTAIFVAASPNWGQLLLLAATIAVAIAVFLRWRRGRKNRRK